VVLHQKVGCQPLALHIRMQITGEHAITDITVLAKIAGGDAGRKLRCALAISAIGKAGGDPVLGDGEGSVLAVIDQAAGKDRACAIAVVDKRIAIGVIADGSTADGRGRMGAGLTRRGINQVRIGGTKAGVINQIIRVIIGLGPAVDAIG
jgi:hypothetical protein